MAESNKKLRKEMMRCYLLGYIAQRHVYYRIISEVSEFSSYIDYKHYGTTEKLVEYGMPRRLARLIVKIVPPIEHPLSIVMCIGMLISYSFQYLFKKRQCYHNRKFYVKLNYQEKRIINMLGSAGYSPEDLTLIDIPEQHEIYEKIHTVSVFSGISYGQLWQSFLNAVSIVCFMKSRYGSVDVLFRSYSSFPFFLCYNFINNLDNSNELVFVNHYDRWMYLFGRSHLHKTYIQHGRLREDRIKRIHCDTAYYLSRTQQVILEKTLFCNKPKAKFRKPFEYCGFDKLKNNGNKDLLIVCLARFSGRYEQVVERLYNRNINIYLKPHPSDNLDTYLECKKKYPEIVILDKFDYPKVDYVISNESTLADEYEMHDTPVLMDTNPDYDKIFNQWFGEYKDGR